MKRSSFVQLFLYVEVMIPNENDKCYDNLFILKIRLAYDVSAYVPT